MGEVINLETDVAIIGGGNAALCAAMTAAEQIKVEQERTMRDVVIVSAVRTPVQRSRPNGRTAAIASAALPGFSPPAR